MRLAHLGIRETTTKAFMPLGVTVNRQAYPLLLAMVCILLLTMIKPEISWVDLLIIILSCAGLGMVSIGSPVVIAGMLFPIFSWLDLTSTQAFIGVTIITGISGLIDPIASATHLFSSCSVTAVIDGNPDEEALETKA